MMKSAFLILILLFNQIPSKAADFRADDLIDNIANCFRTGNSKDLSVHLSSTVSLAILDDNNTYSKNQAEILLRNFFDKYNFKGVKILHRMDTNTVSRYVVLELISSVHKFRVSLSLKNFNSKFLITDIRIDLAQ